MINAKFLKFIIVGIINTLINISIMHLLLLLNIYYLIASACGFILGLLSGFFLNFIWTFQQKSKFYEKLSKYFYINLLSLVFTLIIVFASKEVFALHPIFAQFLAIIMTTIINYYLISRYVFKKL
jgi:putative flippase GtrA